MQEESAPEKIEPYLIEDTVPFTGSDALTISTFCMYHDANTLMLTLSVQAQEDDTLPEDALIVPYFSADGKALPQSALGEIEPLVQGDTPGSYYLTYYLTAPQVNGSTLHVSLENVYTPEQIMVVQAGIMAAQMQWEEDYGADSMTTDAWKVLWKREHLDERTDAVMRELLAESDCILTGTWEADLPIPPAEEESLVIEAPDDQVLEVNALSAQYSHPTQPEESDVLLLTMDDGTVLCSHTSTNEEHWLAEHGYTLPENYRLFAFARGNGVNKTIYSFDKPYPVGSLEKAEVWHFTYTLSEADWSIDGRYELLYEKE